MFRLLLKLGAQLGRIARNQNFSTVGSMPVEIEKGFNEQIAMEYFASFTYFSMAMNFGRQEVALPGCHKFFMERYQEEREHGERLAYYLLRRGNKVALKEIESPTNKCWDSPLEAFKDALQLESNLTKRLFDLRKFSRDKNDLCACLFLENDFLDGQIEENDTLTRIAAQLQKIGNDLTGIFVLDRSLLKNKK